jgi:malate dehydrogenase
MKRNKIALIGAGNIGGQLALFAAQKQLGDVVLLDIPGKEGVAKGKALDIEQCSTVMGFDANITGTSNWADCAGADVVIITAGIPRKPGESRDDLVGKNLPIIRDVAENMKQHCPDAFAIVISNPLDAMVYELKRITGMGREKAVGMAGCLDSARFNLFLSRAANVSVKDTRAMVLGGHGDTMVPVPSACTVNGVPVSTRLPDDVLGGIIERTRKGGGEIVKLMGTSAFYAPAAAAIAMAESYLLDQKRMLPCAVYLTGEYGVDGIYMGVPCIIGGGGVEQVIEVPLTDDEKAQLATSADHVRAIVEIVDRS